MKVVILAGDNGIALVTIPTHLDHSIRCGRVVFHIHLVP